MVTVQVELHPGAGRSESLQPSLDLHHRLLDLGAELEQVVAEHQALQEDVGGLIQVVAVAADARRQASYDGDGAPDALPAMALTFQVRVLLAQKQELSLEVDAGGRGRICRTAAAEQPRAATPLGADDHPAVTVLAGR
jgi:hypothetical protein